MKVAKLALKYSVAFLLMAPFSAPGAGLEIYYDFEDAPGGGSIQDQAGTALFASRHSSRESGRAPVGSAIVPRELSARSRASLDTQGGFLWIRNGATVDFGGDMSLNLWFKADRWAHQRSTFAYSLQGWRVLYNRSARRIEFQTFGKTPETLSFDFVPPADGSWSMLTLVKKGSSLSLYLNAKKIGALACAPALPPGGGFYIGCASTSGRYGYTGLLDDFALWSSAIGETQIEALYDGVSPMDCVEPKPLARTISSPLPATLPAYYPPTDFALSENGEPRAVIVESDMPGFKGMGREIRQALLDAWGVEFPVMGWEEAKLSGKNLILFGPANANDALRRLKANFLLGGNDRGYELRALPGALDWNEGVLYLGGKNRDEVFRAIKQLAGRFLTLEKIPFFVDCEGWNQPPTQEELDAMVAGIEAHYRRFGDVKNQTALDSLLKKPVVGYRMTGRDEYAETFAKMLRVFAENFEEGRGSSKTLPTFRFHLLPQYLYNMEYSPAFTADDRRFAAEFIRKTTEEIMDYWEMAEARKLYRLGKREYLENHPCFAARSVEASARYLLSRYGYKPSSYWKAVADNAFAGVAPNPFSPEDAAGYQYLVYRIFVDYAMASGRYGSEFLRDSAFREYIDSYAKPMMNHLGYTAGYGDAYPTGMRGPWIHLKQARDLLGDEEAEYLLDAIRRSDPQGTFGKTIDQWGVRRNLPPPGKETLGLNVVELKPFKQKRYQLWGLFDRPTLDKAIFRSGWDRHADFMAVTGINGGSHGHFDANGISQYICGDRLWLMEGDYIKKYPCDHNSIVVCRDGQVADQRRKTGLRNRSRASQILAAEQTPDRKVALLSLLLEGYNGVDWIRNIGYAATNGFWVIDELDVKEAGRYAVQCYWRSVGRFDPQPQAVGFVQKPSADPAIANRFFIAEGSGAGRMLRSEFEYCHGKKDGILAGYPFAGKATRYLVQRRDGEYGKGETLRFVNFMQAGAVPPVVRKLAPGAFFATGRGVESLAVLGSYSNSQIQVEADLCIVQPGGIVARGATRIALGGVEWESPGKTNCVLEVDAPEMARLLGTLRGEGRIVEPEQPANLPVPVLAPSRELGFASPVSALAGTAGRFGAGEESGLFSVFDSAGEKIFEHRFPAAVSAVLPVETDGETRWVVALQPESPRTADAGLYLLDGLGNPLWENRIDSFHKRNGTVQTLFLARIHGTHAPPAIIAGSQAWHYYAFSLDGKEIWRAPVVHGATTGAAGDMDGDGKDDIAPGNEYYYHSLIGSQGATIAKKTTSPFDYSTAVLDLDGDGLDEAVFGRGDGYLYTMVPPGNNYPNWVLNVGGKPVALVGLDRGGSALAAATDTGVVAFVDRFGKKTGTTLLPAPIADMERWNGNLLAVALDGYAYAIDPQGRVLSKTPFRFDIDSVHSPEVAVAGKTAAFHSGSKVYLIDYEEN